MVLATGAVQVGAAAAAAGALSTPASSTGASARAKCFRLILTGLPPGNTQEPAPVDVKTGDFTDVSPRGPAEH
ncbi:hypothetical protein GCM10020358_82390 [Amorphoplanes nipponensis]